MKQILFVIILIALLLLNFCNYVLIFHAGIDEGYRTANRAKNYIITEKDYQIQILEEKVDSLIELVPINRIIQFYNPDLPSYVRSEIAGAVKTYSEKNGLNPYMTLAQILVESGFDPNARSSAGALGIMQIKSWVAKYIAISNNICWDGEERLYDPVYNICIGTLYRRRMTTRFGTIQIGLEAYFQGPTAIDSSYQSYSRKVYSKYHEMQNLLKEL